MKLSFLSPSSLINQGSFNAEVPHEGCLVMLIDA